MMSNETIISEARTRAAGMEFSHRRLILEMAKRLELLTSADVVPVVRCKGCKHRGSNLCPMETVELYPWFATKNDAFCSYGERKDNG